MMGPPAIISRKAPDGVDPDSATASLVNGGINPWLARALALRGEYAPNIALGGYDPLPVDGMKGMPEMVARLRAAIAHREPIFVVADYDADGAASAVVAVLGLRAMGAVVDFIVPNRFVHGYGLTPSVVDLVAERRPRPRVIVTVDNGIASNAGVAHANHLGFDVLVTDHHLAGAELPQAAAIVDPNQPGCMFPSKSIAGCGVILYVLTALRDSFRADGMPEGDVRLANLLDVVGVGTIADVVHLDRNNRWLVYRALTRIRAGRARPGIQALFNASRRSAEHAASSDFGFSLGPRINAAGRLADMTTGIRCLLTEDAALAGVLAEDLASLNEHRKEIESEMRDVALDAIDAGDSTRLTRVAFGEEFHEGVVGIVASRIKERDGAPTVVFAPSSSNAALLKGSARGVPGMNLRDAIDRVHKLGMSPERPDGLCEKFGGHAMAAGLTIRRDRLPLFRELFERSVSEALGGALPSRSILVDGDLPNEAIEPNTARGLSQAVWGTGFEEPVWHGEFDIVSTRLVGADRNHLKMRVRRGDSEFEAIQFFCNEEPPHGSCNIAYRLSWNVWNDRERAELLVVDKR